MAVHRTAALSKALAAVVDTCPGAWGLRHSTDGNCPGAFLRYIDNLGRDDLIHLCKGSVREEERGKGWLVLVAEGDTCYLAWKCLEKTQDGWGTWGSRLHLSQDKGEECFGAVVAVVAAVAVVAVVAVVADDGPPWGVVADLPVGLLPQHLG